MSRLGIIVGMQSEASRASAGAEQLPPALRPLVLVSGADPERAYEGAKRLVIQGADALLSFGLAGGLAPGLATGDMVLADCVVLPDGSRIEVDGAWRASLDAALVTRQRLSIGALAGQDRVIVRQVEKAALHVATGALAVDMESHAVARAAKEAGVPFAALRVVLDPAGWTLPRAALAGLGPDGRPRVLPVLIRLLGRPWELASLVQLGRANRRALDALGGLGAALGPAFGLVM